MTPAELARRALYLAACATPPIGDSPIALLCSQVFEADIPWPDHAGVASLDYVRGRHVRTSIRVVGESVQVLTQNAPWRHLYPTDDSLIAAARAFR